MQNREMRCFPLLSSWIARKNSQNENPINNSTCYDTPSGGGMGFIGTLRTPKVATQELFKRSFPGHRRERCP